MEIARPVGGRANWNVWFKKCNNSFRILSRNRALIGFQCFTEEVSRGYPPHHVWSQGNSSDYPIIFFENAYDPVLGNRMGNRGQRATPV